MTVNLDAFCQKYMRDRGRFVPARLQTALALLERLREKPSLDLPDHLAKSRTGLKSHEYYGRLAHKKLNLERIGKTHGRRSNEIQVWGQVFLDLLKDANFAQSSTESQTSMIDLAQSVFAAHLRDILEQEPLEVRVRGRSAEAIIHEVLKQAEDKNKAGEVAQYLVGAKLALRFNRDIPVFPANKADRKSRLDRDARHGDFEIENGVIEVAVGLPDEKHVGQIAEALEDNDSEVWLLTRADRVSTWKNELASTEGLDIRRVVVASVEAFVGQNITELGEFSAKGKLAQLQLLFDLYNSRWISQVGTPGIRIVIK